MLLLVQMTTASLQSSIEAALRKAIEDHKTSTTTATSAEDFVETVRLAVATVLVDTFQSGNTYITFARHLTSLNLGDCTCCIAAPVTIAVSPRATPKKPVRGYIDGCFDIMHSGKPVRPTHLVASRAVLTDVFCFLHT